MTTPNARLTPEREAELRAAAKSFSGVREIFAELDAVRRERAAWRSYAMHLEDCPECATSTADLCAKGKQLLDATLAKPLRNCHCGRRLTETLECREHGPIKRRCAAVGPDGIRCGGILGHSELHHALIETTLLNEPEWRHA